MTADPPSSLPSALRCHLAPLGVPFLVIADDSALLSAVEAACADWLVDAPSVAPPIEIRLSRRSTSVERVSAAITVEGSRLTLSGGGIEGWADGDAGKARCSVPPDLAEDPAALAREVLDTLVLFLLATAGGRIPIHAAGVMIGDTAWLLAGRSGAGKSTLALTAALRGLPVLSDDTVHVQLDPALRIWGLARPIHVFVEEAPPGDHAVRLRAGKRKAAVSIPEPAANVRFAERAELVLLARGDAVSLTPVSADTAIAELNRLDEGFDLLADRIGRAVEVLAARGAWRLTLTDDPGAAIDLLLASGAGA